MYLNIFSNFIVAAIIFVVTLIMAYILFHVLRGVRDSEHHIIVKIFLFMILIPLFIGLTIICVLAGLVALGLTAQAILMLVQNALEIMFHYTTNNMYLI